MKMLVTIISVIIFSILIECLEVNKPQLIPFITLFVFGLFLGSVTKKEE